MVISNDQKIGDVFIEHFDTIEPNLGLAIPRDVIFATNCIEVPFVKAVLKYQGHCSILAIKEKHKDLNFSFYCVSLSNLQNELKRLD